jgi:tetrahydromethanopterin S-methyltransferase subunit A
MVDKKEAAADWPIITGEYEVGDPESPVAVVTLASELDDAPIKAGAALSGPCHTENLGLEKVIANTISNPNIRFLIICGAEVQGHITGQSLSALHENGADPEKGQIIGATGAIPYIDNIPQEGIARFQQQLEIVDMIDIEDAGQVSAKVKECVEKDPGAFEEEAMVIEVDKGDEEEDEGDAVRPVTPETAILEARMRNIQTQIKMIGAVQKDLSGNLAGKVQGIMIGMVFTLVIGALFFMV